MPSEPTIPVLMTQRMRDAIDWAAPEVRLSEVAHELEAVVDAFDAAAARPAEHWTPFYCGQEGPPIPTRCYGPRDHDGGHVWEPKRIEPTWEVGGIPGCGYLEAAARPAEPERTVRWCETHGPPGGRPAYSCEAKYDTADFSHRDCRVTTRSVGGEVTP